MSFDDRVASIPVHVRSDVELHEHNADCSHPAVCCARPVLFWFVEGAIHVHPDRLNDLRVLIVAGRLAFPVPSRTG